MAKKYTVTYGTVDAPKTKTFTSATEAEAFVKKLKAESARRAAIASTRRPSDIEQVMRQAQRVSYTVGTGRAKREFKTLKEAKEWAARIAASEAQAAHVEAKLHPTYEVAGRTFDTKEEAEQYAAKISEELQTQMLLGRVPQERAAAREARRKRIDVLQQQMMGKPSKSTYQELALRSGLAKSERKDGKTVLVLTKPVSELSEAESNIVRGAGFRITKPKGVPGPAAGPKPGSIGAKIQEFGPVKSVTNYLSGAFLLGQKKLDEALKPLVKWTVDRYKDAGYPSEAEIKRIVKTAKNPLDIRDKLQPKTFNEATNRLAWFAGRSLLGGIKDVTFPLSIGVAPVTDQEGWKGYVAELVGGLLTPSPLDYMIYSDLKKSPRGSKVLSKIRKGETLDTSDARVLQRAVDDVVVPYFESPKGRRISKIAEAMDIDVPYSEVRKVGETVRKEVKFLDTANLLKRAAAAEVRAQRDLDRKIMEGMRWLKYGKGIDVIDVEKFRLPSVSDQLAAVRAFTRLRAATATTEDDFAAAMRNLFEGAIAPSEWNKLSSGAKEALVKKAFKLWKSQRGSAVSPLLTLSPQLKKLAKTPSGLAKLENLLFPTYGVGAVTALLSSLDLSRASKPELERMGFTPSDVKLIEDMRAKLVPVAAVDVELTKRLKPLIESPNVDLDTVAKAAEELKVEVERARRGAPETPAVITPEAIEEEEELDVGVTPTGKPAEKTAEAVMEKTIEEERTEEEEERVKKPRRPRVKPPKAKLRRPPLKTTKPSHYRVRFQYYTGSELHRVRAHSFHEALSTALHRRKKPYQIRETQITRKKQGKNI